MRRASLPLVMLALAVSLQATEVSVAEANLRRVRVLVEAGAAPPSALKAAEQQLQDARNEDVLRRTLYSANAIPQDVPEMLRAAGELRVRAADALAAQEKLVTAGVAPTKTLDRYRQDQGRAEQQWELAQSRAKLVEELAEMAQREAALEQEALDLVVRSAGRGVLTERDFFRVESAFYQQFSRPLPVSARGATAVHRSLGFDHRHRFDVALNPDQEEGRWLTQLLERLRVPYIAYRRAVTGRSTGAHIHIGLPSPRL